MTEKVVVPITTEQTTAQEAKAGKENFIIRDLIAVDETASTLTGDPVLDETLSSRWARGAEQGNPVDKVLSAGLDVFQKDHGVKAQAGDVERAEKVVETEEVSGYLNK